MGRCLLLIGFLINVVLGASAQSLMSNFYFNKRVDLYGQGKYEGAIPYFEKSDELDKAELIEGNMRREYSVIWLASCYYKLGNVEKTEKLSPFYRLPRVDQRVTVESDRYGAWAQQKLFEGDYDAALEYVLKGAELEKQYFGKNNLWYGNSLNMVSLCYSYLDDNQKSGISLVEKPPHHRIKLGDGIGVLYKGSVGIGDGVSKRPDSGRSFLMLLVRKIISCRTVDCSLRTAGDYLMNPDSFDKKMEDGILTSKELSRLDLRGLDLVVLSAG